MSDNVVQITETTNLLEIVEVVNGIEISEAPTVVTVVESERVDILAIAEQGPRGIQGEQGPPGGGGASSDLVFTAGTNLSGHRVVIASSDTEINYADKDTPAHEFLVIGIIANAVSVGDSTTVTPEGIMIEPSWTWTPGNPIFLGNNGMMTQSAPTSGFVLEIGVAISSQSIWIAIGQAVELA
jgi:hypothetical protein